MGVIASLFHKKDALTHIVILKIVGYILALLLLMAITTHFNPEMLNSLPKGLQSWMNTGITLCIASAITLIIEIYNRSLDDS